MPGRLPPAKQTCSWDLPTCRRVFTAATSPPQLCESTVLYALGTCLTDFIFPGFLGQKNFFTFLYARPGSLSSCSSTNLHLRTGMTLNSMTLENLRKKFTQQQRKKYSLKSCIPRVLMASADWKSNSHVPNYLAGILKIPAG